MSSWASIAKAAPAPVVPTNELSASTDSLRLLVVDANAIIGGIRLEGIADRAVTIQEVFDEIRDKQSRQFLTTLPYQLQLSEPTEESIKTVTRFARETGDVAALSSTDIKLLALAHTLEVAAHGSAHLTAHASQPRMHTKAITGGQAMPGWGAVPNPEDWKVVDEANEQDEAAAAAASTSRIAQHVQQLSLDPSEPSSFLIEESSSSSGGASKPQPAAAAAGAAGVTSSTSQRAAAAVSDTAAAASAPAAPAAGAADDATAGDAGEWEVAASSHAAARRKKKREYKRQERQRAFEQEWEDHAQLMQQHKQQQQQEDQQQAEAAVAPAVQQNGHADAAAAAAAGSSEDDDTAAAAAAGKEDDEQTASGSEDEGAEEEAEEATNDDLLAAEHQVYTADEVDGGGDVDGAAAAAAGPGSSGDAAAAGSSSSQQQQGSLSPGMPGWQSSVACVTADFAMQNVLLQMGLRLLTRDGRRIARLSRYALRCSACFNVTREPGRLFCPKCGNMTLDRVEVVVGADGAEYFGVRKRHILRGTKFSLPKPRGGRNSKDPVLREDIFLLKVKALGRNAARKNKKPAAAAGGDDDAAAAAGGVDPFAPEFSQDTWHVASQAELAQHRGLAAVLQPAWKNNPNERKLTRSNRRG